MMRCSERKVLTTVSLAATLSLAPFAAHTQEFVADAFGLFTEATSDEGRAEWSGLRQRIGDGTKQSEVVAPGEVDTLLYFLGPKSLVAGKDEGHALGVALDERGNLAKDGQAMDFVLGPLARSGTLRSGIADALFLPPTEAGIHQSGAATATRQSSRAEYRVISDIGSVEPTLLPSLEGPLDPEALHEVATEELRDRYDNRVEDGVVVGFQIVLDDGTTTRLDGVTIDGRATARLLTRDIAGQGSLSAHFASQGSRSIDLEVERFAAVGALPALAAPLEDIGAIGLRVGPFRTDAGHMLNDGAGVRVHATGKTGDEADVSGWIRDGYFDAILPLDPLHIPLSLRVTTPLGTQRIEIDTFSEDPELWLEIAE